MQNRYAGDVGDFVKFAILRSLSPGRRLGVLWWLYPDEAHNADGKHIAYLNQAAEWRSRDPELFDALGRLIAQGDRSVVALQALDLVPGAAYFDEAIPTGSRPANHRTERGAWFERAAHAVTACDLVFVDPDNGLETANYRPTSAKAGKSVALAELAALRKPGRTLIVYHHQTRRAGGHALELLHWGQRLGQQGFSVDAIRASAYSARAFFLLDADNELRERAAAMASSWTAKLTWHPHLDRSG